MTKRMFLALDISETDKVNIAQWRNQHLSLPFKAIDEQNFHITLAFLGLIDSVQQANLEKIIDQQHSFIQQQLKSFILQEKNVVLALSVVGYFKKPQVLHLMPNLCPDWLIYLNKTLVELSLNCGITQQDNHYQPHVSLYRKAKFPFFPAHKKMLQTVFEQCLNLTSFSLYHSYSSLEGVRYQPVHTWKLINLHTN